VIVPTYNEAENLEPLVSAILALDAKFDILIIDDNSPDGTGKIANHLAAERPELHVLHRPGKLGLGTAYVEGFHWAIEQGYDYIFEMDCDFSHDPNYLPRFLQEIGSADLVLGSRYVKGGDTPNWGPVRRIVSATGNLFAKFMLGLKTHDCTGGFRCYRRTMLQRIPWDMIRLQGYGFQVGAVYFVERLGGRVVELPIIFQDRRVGKSKMSFKIVSEAFGYVIRLAVSEKCGRNIQLARSETS
jgi:dolichol-phosphate mannosyltransferase